MLEPDLQTEENKSGMPRETEEQNHRALDQQHAETHELSPDIEMKCCDTKRQKGVRGLGADLRDDTGSEPVIGINQEEHFKRGQHEVGKGAWCG